MNNPFAKLKGDFRLFNAVFAGRNVINKKDPLYAKTKLLFAMLSVFAAVLLWLFVAWNGNGEITRTITLPVTCTKIAQGTDVFKYTENVSVSVSGNMAVLSKLSKNGFTAEVNLSGITAGKYSLPINIEPPAGTRVVAVKPLLAEIEVYKKAEKRFRVALKPVGLDADETAAVSSEIMPSNVSVCGPKEDLDRVCAVEARIPAERLESSDPYTAELIAIDSDDKPVNRVVIAPKTAVVKPESTREGMSVPLKLPLHGQPAEGYEISSVRLTPDTAHLSGEAEDISKIHYIELPAIDVTDIKENLHTVLSFGKSEIAPNVTISGSDKVTVDITVKKGLATKIFPNVPVKIEGAKHGEKWTASPAHVSVIAEAPRTLLENMTSPSFEAVADVTSIVTDNIRLPLIIKGVEKGMHITGAEPDEVLLKREK